MKKKMIKQERCENNDTVNFVYHYSYDSYGNKISCISLLYGQPSEDYYYKYDTRGNIIEEKLYSPNDEGKQEINTIWEYFYDDDNLKIKEKASSLASYLTTKKVSIYSFEYKKENHLPLEKIEKKNNTFEKKTKYKYTFY
ncbi:MAG: hypothetical protein ACO3EE_05420 [Flavobacteriales bacterium]